MTYQLILLPLAEIEIFESAKYYEDKKEGLGFEFLDELEETKIKLIKHPHHYSYISSEKNLRSLTLSHFPFLLIFEIVDNRVIINSVRHDKRKPLQ
jgi:toxin ParE1/3/4